MKHRLAFFFIALLSCLSISAQKFELDPLWGDSIECMVASKPDSLWKISEPIQSVKFPKGMEIESCGKANGYYVAFKKDGASYMAYMGDLKFSSDNPEGTVNPLSEDTVIFIYTFLYLHFKSVRLGQNKTVITEIVICNRFFSGIEMHTFIAPKTMTISSQSYEL